MYSFLVAPELSIAHCVTVIGSSWIPFFIAKMFFHGYHTFFITHAHGDVHMSLIKLTALLEYKIGIKWN